MARHFLDHIDLRVSDLAEARKFYDGWLPALGLSEIVDGEDQQGYTMPGGRKDTPFVWLDVLRGHRGGANRIRSSESSSAKSTKPSASCRSASVKSCSHVLLVEQLRQPALNPFR